MFEASNIDHDVKFSIKFVVNKEKNKVLFAEVDSSFADVLLSFLTLPLGTIVRTLNQHYGDKPPAFGSLSSLYKGLENLDAVHFSTEDAKSILLHPPSSSAALCKSLKIDVVTNSEYNQSVSTFYDKATSFLFLTCLSRFSTDLARTAAGDGVFTMTTASFVITDDLKLQPTATGLLQILGCDGVRDMDKAETVNITFGFSEVMDLLKASLISSTPLSDIIFNKTGGMKNAKYDVKVKEQICENPNMSLKLMVQKSTNKLLYAQAEEDFVEFLFGLLIIPLGRVECLLGRSSTNLKSIDSLYKSMADLSHLKYFKNADAKERLTFPKIPHGYISKKNQILPLPEEENRLPAAVNNGVQENYLLGPRTYMVADNLTVTPFSAESILSILDENEVKMSDVKQVQLEIGLEEALSILKASLTSTSALTDALLPQPLVEHTVEE